MVGSVVNFTSSFHKASLVGLDDAIGTSFAHWQFDLEERWKFTGEDGSTLDHTGQPTSTRQFYLKHHPEYIGRFSVPILFDKKTSKIVCNDTNKILASFSTAFEGLSKTEKQEKLRLFGVNDEVKLKKENFESWFNKDCYYGFDSFLVKKVVTQDFYDSEVLRMEGILEKIESQLSSSRFLFGDTLKHLTASDVKLFIRIMWTVLTAKTYMKVDKFDIRIDFPAIYDHCRDLYNLFGMGPKVVDQHFIIKSHFWKPFEGESLLKQVIVPYGPKLDLSLPQSRINHFSED